MNKSDNIPEVVSEEKKSVETIFLRTVLRKDIYERLKAFAQNYSTGRGDWDFGVAIQILLDHFDSSQEAVVSDKIDYLIKYLQSSEVGESKEPPKEPDEIEMLGGSKIPRK